MSTYTVKILCLGLFIVRGLDEHGAIDGVEGHEGEKERVEADAEGECEFGTARGQEPNYQVEEEVAKVEVREGDDEPGEGAKGAQGRDVARREEEEEVEQPDNEKDGVRSKKRSEKEGWLLHQ